MMGAFINALFWVLRCSFLCFEINTDGLLKIIQDKWLEKLCLILWKCFLLSDRPGLQYWEMQAGRCGLIRLYFDWVKITLHRQRPVQLRISVLAIVWRERGEERERGSQDAKLDTTTQMRAMQLATISSPLPNKLIKHYSQIYHCCETLFVLFSQTRIIWWAKFRGAMLKSDKYTSVWCSW